jgi:hypothetical protein
VGGNFWLEIAGMVMMIPHEMRLEIFSSTGQKDRERKEGTGIGEMKTIIMMMVIRGVVGI